MLQSMIKEWFDTNRSQNHPESDHHKYLSLINELVDTYPKPKRVKQLKLEELKHQMIKFTKDRIVSKANDLNILGR